MVHYKRVGITVKSGLEDKCQTVDAIVSIVQGAGAQVFMDPKRAGGIDCATDLPEYKSEDEIDLLLVIGGDGTILRAVRELSDCTTPILSVNRGRVGFLAETEFDEAQDLIPKFIHGEGVLDERQLLNVKAMRGSNEIISGFTLNEAVIAQGTIARLVDLETRVNDEPLTTFHADGLIIATPTGSTAYNLSSGGPIVHPSLDAMILTPISPHSFSQKPVVIRSDAKVEIVVKTKQKKYKDTEVILTLDGQVYVALEGEDVITITQDARCVKFLRRKQDTFFGTLRNKLKWGERVD
ncbi:MAG: NAD(+)/NADH kinase [Candidatus Peribacteraceae bacterium]|jgi:NAD+ kinase|nr:NAD(+) kinase [bacterium]MDP6561326.1 NAD(+)/NADH kinase [Candidatus Peribacteraceae bacterium]|tara:strand:+ start:16428 stop:17312 length:885 start_codon:yes stop_codon:yes gene_type:complete